MAGRCVRSIFTVWNMSTTPSYLILSSTMLSVMNTPVLPTPALKNKHTSRSAYIKVSTHQGQHTSRSAHIKVSTHQGQLNEQRKSSTHMSAQRAAKIKHTHTIINKCQLNEQPKSSTYHSIAAYGKRSKNWGFLTHYAYSLNILFFHRYAVLSYAFKFTHVPVQEGQVIDAHVIKKLNNKSIKLSGFISIISLQ